MREAAVNWLPCFDTIAAGNFFKYNKMSTEDGVT